jgi:predicted helicase
MDVARIVTALPAMPHAYGQPLMSTTFQDLLNELADASRTNRDKGTQFEKLMANYLMTDPQYADRLSDVWLVVGVAG